MVHRRPHPKCDCHDLKYLLGVGDVLSFHGLGKELVEGATGSSIPAPCTAAEIP